MYFVYLLQCQNGSIYTGITTDVDRRFLEHQKGEGGHYTRAMGVEKILYTEKFKNRSLATKRELEIKTWPREKKLKLVNLLTC
ncbi:GIY-YIG nuclease family protein [Candidatus Azambacteria bacterium]|nr:GIY-YIG nuclease family protein [Candidatus Azambacteria bacterium]